MTALLICGVVGTVGFSVTFLLDGWSRPGYRPAYHAVSALALGPKGWIQTTNFLVSGLLITLGGVGTVLTHGLVWVGVLVVMFGLSLVASGVWRMDPMRGYPPGTPPGDPPALSRAHQRHDGAGVAVFVSLPAAALLAAVALDGVWAWYSGVTAAASVVLLGLFGRAWERDAPLTGLVQRTMILVGWVWLGLLCWHLAGEGTPV